MLKNLFLNTSAIRYAPKEDGTKTAAEIEREQIELETLQPEDEEGDKDKDKDKEDDKSDTDDEGDSEKDGEEEADKEEEAVEETAEEKTIREAEEASRAEFKTKRQIERMQKRIDSLAKKSNTTETENAELKKLLDAKKEDGTLTLTEEEVERRAELKAEEKLIDREFKRDVNNLAKSANTLDKEFNKNIKVVTDEIGLLPPVMIGILADLENEAGKKVGPEVLVYLSKNIDDYEDIYPLSEGRMAIKLQKLAEKVTRKAPKAISQVPKPNDPVGGNRVSTPLNDKMTDAEWIAKREADVKAKRTA